MILRVVFKYLAKKQEEKGIRHTNIKKKILSQMLNIFVLTMWWWLKCVSTQKAPTTINPRKKMKSLGIT